jgi:hypothetical protein
MVYTCHPQLFREEQIGGSQYRQLRHKVRLYLKITNMKKAGGIAQGVESLQGPPFNPQFPPPQKSVHLQ